MGQLTGQSKKLKAVELGNAQKAQVGHGTGICQQINGIFLQLIFLTNRSYWFTSRSARHHKNDERLAGQGAANLGCSRLSRRLRARSPTVQGSADPPKWAAATFIHSFAFRGVPGCLHRAPRRFPHSPKRQRGDGFTGQTVPALTLGAMWPPRNTAKSIPFAACRYAGHGRKPASGFRRTPSSALTLGVISPVEAHR